MNKQSVVHLYYGIFGLSRWHSGKESANARDTRKAGSVPRLGRPLEKRMATHSSIRAYKILWTEEPGGLESMEYSLAIKRNELSSHEITWRKLKCTLLNERDQSEKTTYCLIPKIWHPGKGKTRDRRKNSGCQRLGEGEWIDGAQGLLHHTVMSWRIHDSSHLAKPIGGTTTNNRVCTTQRADASVNYGF